MQSTNNPVVAKPAATPLDTQTALPPVGTPSTYANAGGPPVSGLDGTIPIVNHSEGVASPSAGGANANEFALNPNADGHFARSEPPLFTK